MINWFCRLMEANREGLDLAALASPAKADSSKSETDLTVASAPSSHLPGLIERGDAKLMMDVELCLRGCDDDSLASLQRLESAFNVSDRGHLGTLSREQVVNLLRSFRLHETLRPVLARLLDRCAKQGRVDWTMALRFLERGRTPMPPATSGFRPSRRDMHSSSSNPLPASPLRSIPPTEMPPRPSSDHTVELNRLRDEEESLERRSRMDQLSRIETQIQSLSLQSDQLRRQMEVAQRSSTASSGGERLMEALGRHDPALAGWISTSKARQVIQQYNDLHRLGLNVRFVDSILVLAADETERRVSLDVLRKYLSPAE
jgi:hypothetical protein